ncbi:hypothetical protein CASFOL_014949 [Castilleja foliolosa]|uniref:Large ribosomal subunit protein bL12c n=1 Tax=Castilleja foliolosa TaxID=1961234 RepID=A0ABD3DCA7_9LAMI
MSLIARVRHLHPAANHLRSAINAVTKQRHFTRPAITLEDAIEIDQRMLPTDYDPSSFDPTAPHRSPPTDRVWRLVDEVTGLTLIEATELSNIMMDRFCKVMTNKLSFKERYVIKLMRPDVADEEKSDGGGKPELKKAFDLRIESFEAASKLKVIKEIRGFLGLGLKEAKEMVEKAPSVLKKGVVKEEAEQIVEKMKAIGAKVVLV